MDSPIYLDYNATTPILNEVAKAMIPYLYEHHGNPSSSHRFGVTTKSAVEKARMHVANLLNCLPNEIIFTSGGTESNNFAIQGIASRNRERGKHIITSAIEHPAVIEVCKWLSTQGFDITVLPVDKFGLVKPSALDAAITPQTTLVTIMHANNEVGTLQPIRELAKITHHHGAVFHTDAAQSVGKVSVDVRDLNVDLLSIAGHKLYAPKGIGVLYIRDGTEVPNLMFGASHERGRRPGTENVLEIVGLGKACEIAASDLDLIQNHFRGVRDRLHIGLSSILGCENIQLNGHPEKRLPNTLSISFRKIPANDLLLKLKNHIAASAGSACHAEQVEVSSVLDAMKIRTEWAMGTVRFSVGRGTTENQINQAVPLICDAVNDIRKHFSSVVRS